jgi:adenylate cyclase
MSRLAKAVIAGLVTGILGVVLSALPFGLDLEEDVDLYLLFKLRGTREAPADVVIVNIDKASAEKLNIPADPEKWPRSLHARLTENLAQKGASVVAFDIIFDEASSKQEDNLFSKAIENAQNVVLGELLKWDTIPATDEGGVRTETLSIEKLVPPIEPLARSALALAPFPLPKVPVKVSQYWTFKKGAGDTPTLPIVVFQVYALGLYADFFRLLEKVRPSQAERLPNDKEAVIRTKSVEKLVRELRDAFQSNPSMAESMLEESQKTRAGPPRAKESQIITSLIKMYQGPDSRYLNFYGPPGTIPTVCYYQVLDDQEKSSANHKHIDFKAKAVFVGLSERLRPEQKDGFYTVFSQPTGIDMSGVEIAATAFANLLEDRPVRPFSPKAHMAFMMIWGLLVGILCRLFPTVLAAGSMIGLGAFYLFAARYQFTQTAMWYPLVFPLFFQTPLAFFGTVLWKHFETNKERENMRRAIGNYLSNDIVDHLAKNKANFMKIGEIVYGTCLFTDAANYTAISETMDPKKLSEFMDKYFEAIFKPVKKHGGLVVDLKGDSILAVWKAKQPDVSLRRQACLAALRIQEAVRDFHQSPEILEFIAQAARRSKISREHLTLPTRIGVHSGEILLGTVGAVDHYEYRPTGDTVNTASRMEGLNKHLGTQILVSEDVIDQLDDFLTREVGGFLVAGKSKPVVVHELICRMEECNEEQKRLCEIFSKALKACRRQSWGEAKEIFQESMSVYGQDGPCKFFIKKCEEYQVNPPPETWDGVVDVKTK